MSMDGVVSLLPDPFYSQVEDIWHDLELSCGVKKILITPTPHFSWHVAQKYDVQRVRKALTALGCGTPPFLARVAGLGVFSGERPVVYLALVKDRPLLEFHERLWKALEGAAWGVSSYYAPENWMPHVTVVFEDLCLENLECVLGKLLFQPFDYAFQVDNLALIGQDAGGIGRTDFSIPLEANG